MNRYKVVVTPLSEADGGGFLATVPALPGCMSDGETLLEAVSSVQDAIECWIEEAKALGRPIPAAEETKSRAGLRVRRRGLRVHPVSLTKAA